MASVKGTTATTGNSATEQVAAQLVALTEQALPLVSGLRAAAAEAPRRAVRNALQQLANDLERGQLTTRQAVERLRQLPPGMRALLGSALQQGTDGPMLGQYIEQQVRQRELSRSIWRLLAYPLFLLGLAVVVFLMICVNVIGEFAKMYDEFGLMLPAATQLVLWWSTHLAGPALKALPIVVAGGIAVRMLLPPAARCRLRALIPLVGPLYTWMAVVQWTRLLRMLLAQRVVLPEALQSVSDSMADAALGRASAGMAERVRAGGTLADAVEAATTMPATLVPIVRWGERDNDLVGALDGASQYFEDRFWARRLILNWLLPPFVFVILTIMVVGFIVTALFLPMVDLFAKLS